MCKICVKVVKNSFNVWIKYTSVNSLVIGNSTFLHCPKTAYTNTFSQYACAQIKFLLHTLNIGIAIVSNSPANNGNADSAQR